MATFKLATFNLHHGKEKDVRYSTSRLCQDVASLEADIICIQEADVLALRTCLRNQPGAIAKFLDFDYRSTFVRFFGVGCQYNAVISRFAIQSSKEIVLPSIKSKQRRVALSVDVIVGGELISVMSTHLNTDGKLSSENETAQKQLEFLVKGASQEKLIIGGDFNLDQERVLAVLKDSDFDAPSGYLTSPAGNPKNQIDWIISRGLKSSDVKVSDKLFSDHRALVATFNI